MADTHGLIEYICKALADSLIICTWRRVLFRLQCILPSFRMRWTQSMIIGRVDTFLKATTTFVRNARFQIHKSCPVDVDWYHFMRRGVSRIDQRSSLANKCASLLLGRNRAGIKHTANSFKGSSDRRTSILWIFIVIFWSIVIFESHDRKDTSLSPSNGVEQSVPDF